MEILINICLIEKMILLLYIVIICKILNLDILFDNLLFVIRNFLVNRMPCLITWRIGLKLRDKLFEECI